MDWKQLVQLALLGSGAYASSSRSGSIGVEKSLGELYKDLA